MSEELATALASLLETAIGLSVVLVMFSMGLALNVRDAFSIWRSPKRLGFLVLSALVAAPLVAYGLVTLFSDAPAAVRVGILLCAAAGGNGLVPKLAERIGADSVRSVSSLVSLALLTVISAPLVITLAIPTDSTTVTGTDVAQTVLGAIIVPILIGVAIRQWWVSAAGMITEPLTNIADKLVVVVVLVIIVKDLDVVLGFGVGPILLLFTTAVLLTAVGHILGGPASSDRLELGLFTGQRQGAVALLVAVTAFPEAIPGVIAYGVAALVIAVAYVGTVGNPATTKAGSSQNEEQHTVEPTSHGAQGDRKESEEG